MKWFIKGIKNYTLFKGRASRTEFWNFILYWVIFYVIIIAIDRASPGYTPSAAELNKERGTLLDPELIKQELDKIRLQNNIPRV